MGSCLYPVSGGARGVTRVGLEVRRSTDSYGARYGVEATSRWFRVPSSPGGVSSCRLKVAVALHDGIGPDCAFRRHWDLDGTFLCRVGTVEAVFLTVNADGKLDVTRDQNQATSLTETPPALLTRLRCLSLSKPLPFSPSGGSRIEGFWHERLPACPA